MERCSPWLYTVWYDILRFQVSDTGSVMKYLYSASLCSVG